jgi:hypothetical protein
LTPKKADAVSMISFGPALVDVLGLRKLALRRLFAADPPATGG